MTGETLQEITITECNRGKTNPILTTDYKLLASFYFTLSAAPSEDWIHIFEQVRHDRSRHSSSSALLPARVDAHGIVIKCRPDDLQQCYDGLKADVAAANQQYREALAKHVRDEKLKQTIDHAIDDALAKLKL